MSGGNWKELFEAACAGDLDLVRYHIDGGVDVNYAHPEYLATPLVACILADQRQPAPALGVRRGDAAAGGAPEPAAPGHGRRGAAPGRDGGRGVGRAEFGARPGGGLRLARGLVEPVPPAWRRGRQARPNRETCSGAGREIA